MKKRLPKLRDEKTVHAFWSKHSVTEFPADMEALDEKIQLAPELASRIQERMKKKMIALRLELWQLKRTKEIAAKKHLPYQHLLRFWISQGLKREAAAV